MAASARFLSCNLLSSPAADIQVWTQTTVLTQVMLDMQVYCSIESRIPMPSLHGTLAWGIR
jgi:hypothetical protein